MCRVLSAVFTVKRQISVDSSSQPTSSIHTYSDAVKCFADSEDITGSQKGEDTTEVREKLHGSQALAPECPYLDVSGLYMVRSRQY